MNVFSIYHFIYLAICVLICLAFYFIFRNKSDKVKYIATFIPLVLAFIVHFLKLLIPYYRDYLPQSIMTITFESVCAISTLTFPFIYLSKNKILKNYMVVIGTLSGILTLLLPLGSQDVHPFDLEMIRFFFAHLAIFMSSFFMYVFNIHKPTGKWIKHSILLLILSLFIAHIDSIIFTFILEGKEAGIDYLKELNIIN